MRLELRTDSDAVDSATDGPADVWFSGFRTGVVVSSLFVVAVGIATHLGVWAWELMR